MPQPSWRVTECRELVETARRAVSTADCVPLKSLSGKQGFAGGTELAIPVTAKPLRISACIPSARFRRIRASHRAIDAIQGRSNG